MSAGWQVGDLALCIKRGLWRGTIIGELRATPAPSYNEIRRVRRVGILPNTGLTVLWLEGYEGDAICFSFTARRFRKIKPDTEPCEEEFAALIKRKVDA